MFHRRAEVRLNSSDPGMCAYRHVGVPGRMVPRWVHCRCPARTHGPGHFVWLCEDCRDEGRDEEAWLYPRGHQRGDENVRATVAGLGPDRNHVKYRPGPDM